jgi:hypothetical protein
VGDAAAQNANSKAGAKRVFILTDELSEFLESNDEALSGIQYLS